MPRFSLTLFAVSVTVLTLILGFERAALSDALTQTSPPFWPSSSLQTIQNSTTAPPPVTDLSIAKRDAPDPAQVMEPLTYTVTISNQETVDAKDVTLIDALPLSVLYDSAAPSQGSCDSTSLIVLCLLGDVPGQSVVTVTIVVTPTVAGEITNRAFVISQTPDVDPANNRAEEATQVGLSAAPDQRIYIPLILNSSN